MAAPPADIGARARTLTLVAMTLANSMILIDQTAVPLAIPRITHELGGSVATGQWVLIANVLALGALMVFGGRLGDLFGLRRVFLAGAVTFITSSALVGAAQNVPWLLSMRVTQGIGAALMMPTTMAIIGAVFPPTGRGRALGLMAGASAFFAAMGPLLGGLLTEYLGWRAVFWVNVPLAAITVLLTLANTPAVRPADRGARAIDTPGLVAFALGICGLTIGFGQADAWGWASPSTLGALAAGVAGLVVFVLIDRQRPEPLMDLSLFRLRSLTASNVSQVAVGAIALITGYLLPFYLLLVVGISPGAAGIALLPSTIPVILAAPLAGRWFDRVGGRVPLIVGYAVLTAACIARAIGVAERSIAGIVPGLVVLGIGLGIVQTVNDPVGLDEVPNESQGQASGVIDTSEQVGGAMGSGPVLVPVHGRVHPAGVRAPRRSRHPGHPRRVRGRTRVRHAGGTDRPPKGAPAAVDRGGDGPAQRRPCRRLPADVPAGRPPSRGCRRVSFALLRRAPRAVPAAAEPS